MPKLGDTFLSPNLCNEKKHFSIIISINDDKLLFVNVTTKINGKDDTCILTVNDHSFIRHDSIINYAEAVYADIDDVREAIVRGIFERQSPVSLEVLKRIQEGAIASPSFPPKLLPFINIPS